jgi:uncharacterized protein YlaI
LVEVRSLSVQLESNIPFREGKSMISYEVKCFSCKKVFRVYEGTVKYKLFKENRKGIYSCEDCDHKIRMEAIKNFFR